MSQHLPNNDTSLSQANSISDNSNRPVNSANPATSVKSPHDKPIHKTGNDLSLSLFPRWIRSNRMGSLAAGFAIAAWAQLSLSSKIALLSMSMAWVSCYCALVQDLYFLHHYQDSSPHALAARYRSLALPSLGPYVLR